MLGGDAYRVGANRLFVDMARCFAGARIASLRFDPRGRGDSDGPPPPFDELAPDLCAAIDALQDLDRRLKRIVVVALCDGVQASVAHAAADSRVTGLVLINPWVETSGSRDREAVRVRYRRRLLERRFWRDLLHGRVRLSPAVRTIARFFVAAVPKPAGTRESEQAHDPASRLGKALQQVDAPVRLVLSGCDRTADVLRSEATRNTELKAAFARPSLSVTTYAEADHTFSDRGDRDALITHLQGWLTEDRSIRDQSSQKGTRP